MRHTLVTLSACLLLANALAFQPSDTTFRNDDFLIYTNVSPFQIRVNTNRFSSGGTNVVLINGSTATLTLVTNTAGGAVSYTLTGVPALTQLGYTPETSGTALNATNQLNTQLRTYIDQAASNRVVAVAGSNVTIVTNASGGVISYTISGPAAGGGTGNVTNNNVALVSGQAVFAGSATGVYSTNAASARTLLGAGVGTVTSVTSGDTNLQVLNPTTTPVITFTNANGTGPFARSNTTGNFTVSGNVGIGTTTPGQKLEVAGNLLLANGVNNITQYFGNINYGVSLDYSSGNFDLFTAGAKRITIQNGGNVGIGTVGPSYKLDVVGDIRIANNKALYFDDYLGNPRKIIEYDNSQHLYIGAGVVGDDVFIKTSAGNPVRISGSQVRLGGAGNNGLYVTADNAGVGTSATDKALEVNSPSGQNLRLTYNDSDGSAANYADLLVSSSGDLTVTPSGGDATINGTVTATGGFISQTTTGNAPAGGLGEYVSALLPLGSAVSLTTATAANVTTISLTAGDWDVRGNVNYSEAGVTVTETVGGVTTASATIPTDGSEVYSGAGIGAIGLSAKDSVTLPSKRISLSGTTTVYLVGKSTFSVGTVSAYGTITARRVQ